jgi:hypothetical protein
MFDPNSLMPHAVCWASDPRLIWTMAVTNFVTFLSYLTIASTLIYLVRRTGRILVRDWGYFFGRIRPLYSCLRINPLTRSNYHLVAHLLDRCMDQHYYFHIVSLCGSHADSACNQARIQHQ